MNLIETLKQFKKIEADKGYTRKSRALILNTRKEAPTSVWDLFLKNLELGSAVALAGILVFMIVGGFSAWRTSPLQLGNLDPAGLKAEAQAVDMQIQLANLNYGTVAPQPGSSAPTQAAPSVAPKSQQNSTVQSSTTQQTSNGNANSSATVSVDEALQQLSE